MGKESVLARLSVDFSVAMVEYYRWLSSEQHEYVLSRQILRSGTSIGANIHEAYYAISKAEFVAKMQIALKEAAETEYWFMILERTNQLSEPFRPLAAQCEALKRMLVSTLRTTKAPTL